MKFELYREPVTHDYRWRLKASNGRIVAEGGEGYRNFADMEHELEQIFLVDHKQALIEALATRA